MTQSSLIALLERIYRAMLVFYPVTYRREYGPWMVQVFRDMSRTVYRKHGRGGLAWWWVVTFADLIHTAIERHIEEHTLLSVQPGQVRNSDMTIQKWGGLASFLLAATLLIPPVLYIVSEFNRKLWPVGFPLADFLFGPLCGASLVLAVYALRERIGGYARHQMSLALLAAALAAAMFVTAASFRSANRQYLQYLEGVGGLVSSDPVMSWKTIVAGVIGTGRHFLGWSLILTGSAGLSSKALPRLLCILYLVSGALSLFAYLIPVRGELALVSTLEAVEATMVLMSAMCAVWQGIVLSRGGPGATPTLQPSPEPA